MQKVHFHEKHIEIDGRVISAWYSCSAKTHDIRIHTQLRPKIDAVVIVAHDRGYSIRITKTHPMYDAVFIAMRAQQKSDGE